MPYNWLPPEEHEAELARLAQMLMTCRMEGYVPTVRLLGMRGWWAVGCVSYKQDPHGPQWGFVTRAVWGD